VEATVIKRITGDWQLVLFFDNPVEISSVWGSKKVFENKPGRKNYRYTHTYAYTSILILTVHRHSVQIPKFGLEQASWGWS
jgi:hypothetical protein